MNSTVSPWIKTLWLKNQLVTFKTVKITTILQQSIFKVAPQNVFHDKLRKPTQSFRHPFCISYQLYKDQKRQRISDQLALITNPG